MLVHHLIYELMFSDKKLFRFKYTKRTFDLLRTYTYYIVFRSRKVTKQTLSTFLSTHFYFVKYWCVSTIWTINIFSLKQMNLSLQPDVEVVLFMVNLRFVFSYLLFYNFVLTCIYFFWTDFNWEIKFWNYN